MFFLDKIVQYISNKTPDPAESFLTPELLMLTHKAILSGEYYEKGSIDKIKEIKKQLGGLQSALEVATITFPGSPAPAAAIPAAKIVISDRAEKELEQYDTRFLSKLQELTSSVVENLSFSATGEDGVIVDTAPLRNYKFKKDVADLLHTGVSTDEILNDMMFEINILLAYLDEYLECNKEILDELTAIDRHLKKQFRNDVNGEIFDLLKQKAAFLAYKIQRRNKKTKPLTSIPEWDENNAYSEFKHKLDAHYKTKKQTVKQAILSCEEYNPETSPSCKLEDFHGASHFFRRVSEDHNGYRKNELEKLLKKIQRKRKTEGNLSLFDQVAFKSFDTLLFNSSIDFKIRLEKEDANFSNVLADIRNFLSGKKETANVTFLDEIEKELTHYSGINSQNYYCYELFLEFLDSLLKYLRSNPAKTVNFEKNTLDETDLGEIRKRIESLTSYIRTLYASALNHINSNLDKMMTHEIKPVYLSWEECFIKHKWEDGVEGHLFVDSAYVLPNNFEAIKSKIYSWEIFLDTEMNLLTNSIELQLNINFIENKNLNFEKKVRENEIKVVQIVSIFVSIATFVLINVKIFDNKSGLESFAIILGLASCFVLFNSFFYFMIYAQMQQPKLIRARIFKASIFVILPVVLAAGSYFMLKSEGEKSSKDFKDFKEKMRRDSIETRLRIDIK